MSYQPTHEENELSFELINNAIGNGTFLQALIRDISREIEKSKPGEYIFLPVTEEGSFLAGFKENGWEFVPDAKLSSCENTSGSLIWKGPGYPVLSEIVDALHRYLRSSGSNG